MGIFSDRISVKDKKITLMGLGLLGRGVNVAKFLLKNGAKLTITDLKSPDLLEPSINQLLKYQENIKYVLEKHLEEDFTSAEIVVKAPGVPRDSSFIEAATNNNIELKMDASWLVSLLDKDVNIIGITGTKGKSTVTHLIEYILKTAGKRVFIGGNVRGMATLPLLDELKKGDYLVLEIDSWQCQGFHDEKISPTVSVFTNLMPDHLNYYKGMRDYFLDKSAIYKYQTKNDFLVLSPSSFGAINEHGGGKPKAKTAIVKPAILPTSWKFSQPGEHNRMNAAQAYQACKFLNVDDSYIKEGLEHFPGVPGRLEFIVEKDGVIYYNDTNATTPEAVAASLSAFPNREVFLIAGGINKGLIYGPMAEAINKYVSKVFLFPGGVSEDIKPKLSIEYSDVSDMKEAVSKAVVDATEKTNSVVIMSPGGSSFGLFRNEYDRGDQFVEAVNNI